jgi:3D (Asp-Asp-Asp) domain-containing protein
MRYFIIIILCLSIGKNAIADDLWLVTGYCSCKICCGKNAKGITASGKAVKEGFVACNWLPFGTKVKIQGKVYIVEDRGSIKYFGTKKQKVKHIDIYFKTHQEAKQWGKKWLEVEILQKER